MSFAYTAQPDSIRLESVHILHANLKDHEGKFIGSSMDLDRHIGNVNGNLAFDSGDFSRTATNVRLDLSESPNRVLLFATLKNENGSTAESSIDLNQRITNRDGHLEY
ncbi:cyanovirin-N family protein [Rhizoctonia solani AG-3 Rhs1AP]|uniref:Cyanovirin-N family protein n=2 Tax=Rhizoctonia solani AG-3 TaxID=1086053 RepID=A0A074SE73_9AGAM|nr:cyanovirin-N family protein [Rhizoctonia solani AG-3 Rhs1AP]KEP48292.1 cyanovirin-N family protein [Rhizoctonia solani 123E]